MRRLAAATALLVGCSFEHGSLMSSSPDAAPDSGPTCADVVCDPNATCATGAEPSCTCNAGYSGDGLACAAIDPCATNNGGCQAACEMTGPGTSQCYAPATCVQLAAHETVANDTSVTLYVNQDPAKPWTAFCHNNLEYLTLTTTPDSNFGQYTASTKSPGTSVRTTYARVRLDPTNLKVDISDQTFSTSTGALKHDPANNGDVAVTSMPLGVAMDCIPGGTAATGVAKVTLTGTPFTVTSGWTKAGNTPLGSANSSSGGRIVSITGGGNCGWNAPTGAPTNPFNTFAGANLLVLAYAP